MGVPADVGADDVDADVDNRAVLVLLPDGTVRLFCFPPCSSSSPSFPSSDLRATDIVSHFPPQTRLSTSPALHPTLAPDTCLTHSRTYHLVPPPQGSKDRASVGASTGAGTMAGAEEEADGGRYSLRKSVTGKERRARAQRLPAHCAAGELHSQCVAGNWEASLATRVGAWGVRQSRGTGSAHSRPPQASWALRGNEFSTSPAFEGAVRGTGEAGELVFTAQAGGSAPVHPELIERIPPEQNLEWGLGLGLNEGGPGDWTEEGPPMEDSEKLRPPAGEGEEGRPPALADIIAELKNRRTGIQNELLDLHRRGVLPAGLPAVSGMPAVTVPTGLEAQSALPSPFDDPEPDEPALPSSSTLVEEHHGGRMLGPRRQSGEREWGLGMRSLSMRTFRRARQGDAAVPGARVLRSAAEGALTGDGALAGGEAGFGLGGTFRKGLREGSGETAGLSRSLRHSGREVLAKISSIVRKSASETHEGSSSQSNTRWRSELQATARSQSSRYGSRDSLARISSLVHTSESHLSHAGGYALGIPEGPGSPPPYGIATSVPFLETEDSACAGFEETDLAFTPPFLRKGTEPGLSFNASQFGPMPGATIMRIVPSHSPSHSPSPAPSFSPSLSPSYGPTHSPSSAHPHSRSSALSPSSPGMPTPPIRLGPLPTSAHAGQKGGDGPAQPHAQAQGWVRPGREAVSEAGAGAGAGAGSAAGTKLPSMSGSASWGGVEGEGKGELARFSSLPRTQGRKPKPPPGPVPSLPLRKVFHRIPPRVPLSPDSHTLPSTSGIPAKPPRLALSPDTETHTPTLPPTPGTHQGQGESPTGSSLSRSSGVHDSTVGWGSASYSSRGGKPPIARSPRMPPLRMGSPVAEQYASDKEEGELVRSSTVGSVMRAQRPHGQPPAHPVPLSASQSLPRVPYASHRRTRGVPTAINGGGRQGPGPWAQVQEEGEGGTFQASSARLGSVQPRQAVLRQGRDKKVGVFEAATPGIPSGGTAEEKPSPGGFEATVPGSVPGCSSPAGAPLESLLDAGALHGTLVQAWGTLPAAPVTSQGAAALRGLRA